MAIGTAAAIVGSAVIGGVIQGKAAKSAAKTQAGAAREGISEQRAAREQAREDAQPFVDIGLEAGGQLQNFLADPNAGLEQINPVVDFLRKQGFEQIQESAAAGSRLGAGGTLQDLTQFNSDLTSTVIPQLQNQRFNQLFNTFTAGQNAAAGQGTATLNTASNVGNLLNTAGRAQAGGQIGQANAITGAISNVAGAAGAFPNLFGQQGTQLPPGGAPGGGTVQPTLTQAAPGSTFGL